MSTLVWFHTSPACMEPIWRYTTHKNLQPFHPSKHQFWPGHSPVHTRGTQPMGRHLSEHWLLCTDTKLILPYPLLWPCTWSQQGCGWAEVVNKLFCFQAASMHLHSLWEKMAWGKIHIGTTKVIQAPSGPAKHLGGWSCSHFQSPWVDKHQVQTGVRLFPICQLGGRLCFSSLH